MSVLNETSRIQEIATTGETNFDFPFRIFEDTDLWVGLTPVGQVPDPSQDKLILNVNYTVNILPQSGSITLIIPATLGDIITIERDVPSERRFDYNVGGKFTGPTMDFQLDSITIQIAQNKSRQLKRGLTYEITDQLKKGDVTLPQLEAEEFWKKNASGNLVGVACTDNDGCSTLRSELLSETSTAPGTDNVGYYDAIDGGQNLTEKFAEIAPQKDDRSVVKNAVDETKQIKIDADNISTGNTRTIVMPDHDVDLGDIPILGLPINFLHGFPPLLDIGDPLHDINISDGSCRDSTDATDIIYSGSMIKQIDANWSAGTNQGGFPSSLTLTAFIWYHVFVIMKEDKTIDFGFDSDLNATNLLADATDFIYYRRIGAVIPNVSLELYQYVYKSDNSRRIWFHTPTQLVYNANNPGVSTKIINCGVPSGIEVYVMMNVLLSESTGDANEIYISCPAVIDENPTPNGSPLATVAVRDNKVSMQKVEVFSNNTSQVRIKLAASSSDTTVRIVSLGWSEHL